MRQEWKDYRSRVIKSFKYGGMAIGISFLFFLVNLPSTPKDQIKIAFIANMTISVFIALLVSSMFALIRLFYTLQEIKTGIKRELNPILGFVLSFCGMTAGLVIGLNLRARILNEKPDFSYLGTVLLSGAFISI